MSTPTSDEMRSALEAAEARVDARLANFDTSVKTGFAEMLAQFADLRAEMSKQFADVRAEMANFRAEMHRGLADLRKWGSGIALAAVAATVGLVTYLGKSAGRPPPGPAAALIVIYVQPQPAPAPVAPAPAPSS